MPGDKYKSSFRGQNAASTARRGDYDPGGIITRTTLFAYLKDLNTVIRPIRDKELVFIIDTGL